MMEKEEKEERLGRKTVTIISDHVSRLQTPAKRSSSQSAPLYPEENAGTFSLFVMAMRSAQAEQNRKERDVSVHIDDCQMEMHETRPLDAQKVRGTIRAGCDGA